MSVYGLSGLTFRSSTGILYQTARSPIVVLQVMLMEPIKFNLGLE